MKFSQKQITIAGGVIAVILIGGFLVVSNIRQTGTSLPPVTFTIWGTEPSNWFDAMTSGYQTLHPNATVKYVQVAPAKYQSSLLTSLAAGTGPDLFIIGNHDVPKFKDIIVPIAASELTPAQVDANFPTVVSQDMVIKGSIYALPLYIDTMALFYNKDLFDTASIANPPVTWNELLNLIPALKSVNEQGQIQRSAVALGGSERSVDRGVDVLNLLMLQNGVTMTSLDLTSASFASADRARGESAFNFYLQFANSSSPYYTWHDAFQNSLESFASGKVAMIFDYHESLKDIQTKSPFLRVGVAPVPLAEGGSPITYANYEGFAVSKQSKVAPWAWDFIRYTTTNKDALAEYLTKSNRLGALRTLIAGKINDSEFGVFAKGALSARSWYIVDYARVVDIFSRAIQSVFSGGVASPQALRVAEEQITSLMRQ